MRLTRAEINVKSLRHNFDGIKKKVGLNVKIMGIVKANAYGHGIVEISQALGKFGIDYLGVGFQEEGVFLREQGITIPILVLGGVLGDQVRQFLEYDLDITVSSIEIAERIEREVESNNNRKARVHLKIDTGMERIGVNSSTAPQFIEKVCRLKHLDVVGIYSHFASSDERDKTFAYQQLDRFNDVLLYLEKNGIEIPLKHIANSGAILDLPDSYYTMVRPGIMLYGIYPTLDTTESVPLQSVLSFKSKVVFIKEVPAGISISYGRKYFTTEHTRVATVPAGYGDGYSRRLTNQMEVLINGKRYPVVGTICMDQMMVDVGIDSTIHVGNDVTLFGKDGELFISAYDIADKLDTNPYEVLTGIAARVPRVVLN
jgi:alanine racemase